MSQVTDLPGNWAYLYKPAPTLDGDSGVWKARIAFVTDQSNVIPFVTTINGVLTPITTSGGTMQRWIPLEHPTYAGLFAKKISVEMFGEASTTSTELVDLHSKARVVVDFESYPFGISGDTAYMALSVAGSGLYTSIPGRKMAFSTGEVLGQDSGGFVGQTTYQLKLFQCASLSDNVLDAAMNKINNAPFFGKPASQMRFDTWSADYSVTVGGVLTYTKSLQFTYQDHDWNKYFRSDGVLDTALDPAGNPTYQTSDFSLLLVS